MLTVVYCLKYILMSFLFILIACYSQIKYFTCVLVVTQHIEIRVAYFFKPQQTAKLKRKDLKSYFKVKLLYTLLQMHFLKV